MTLAERDAYVIAKLAAFKAAGMSDRQSASEVQRTGGFAAIILPGIDVAALDADVTGLQAAVADIAAPTVRAASTAELKATGVPTAKVPQPAGTTKTNSLRMRAIQAGA